MADSSPGADGSSQLDPQDSRRLLQDTYLKLAPRNMDLLHDMGWSERFLVDGESLLWESLCFKDRLNPGQPVQVLFWVETRLKQLLDRGGRFIVLFYSSFDTVWAADPRAAALRQLLQQHLRALAASGGGQFQVHTCDTFFTKDWLELVQQLKPRFVMVTDGVVTPSTPTAPAADSSTHGSFTAEQQSQHSAVDSEVAGQLRQRLLALSFAYLGSKTDLVYMAQLRADSHTVYGFLQSSANAHKVLAQHSQPIAAAVRALAAVHTAHECNGSIASSSAGSGPGTHTEDAAVAELQQLAARLGSWRLALAVQSCKQALAAEQSGDTPAHADSTAGSSGSGSGSYSQWLASAYLLHAVLLDELPLHDRALPGLTAAADKAAAAAAMRFCQQVLRQVAALAPAAYQAAQGLSPQQHNGSDSAGAAVSPAAAGSHDAGQPGSDSSTGGSDDTVKTAALASLADAYDTKLFLTVAVVLQQLAAQHQQLLLSGGDAEAVDTALLSGVSDTGRNRWAAAVALLQGGDMLGSTVDANGSLAEISTNAIAVAQHADAAVAVAVQELLDNAAPALGDASSAALAEAQAAAEVLARQQQQRQQELQQIAGHQQQHCLGGMQAGNSLIGAVRQALAAEDRPNAAAAGANGAGQAARADGGQQLPAGAMTAMSRFGVGSFRERYHWHIRNDLKAFFLLEGRDASGGFEARKHALIFMREEQLTAWRFKKHLTESAQIKVPALMRAFREEKRTKHKQQLLDQAADLADKALVYWQSRQDQFAARAMQNMVLSLAGSSFYSGSKSSRSASSSAGGSTTATSKGSGSKGKATGKAELLKQQNNQRREQEKQQAEEGKWRTVALPLVLKALQEATVSNCSRAVEAVSGFMEKCEAPSVRAIALAAKLLVLYEWLRPSGASAAAAAHGAAGEDGSVSSAAVAAAKELMLTIMQVLSLPVEQQQAPVQLPVGSDCAPLLAVTAAVAGSIGYKRMSAALLDRMDSQQGSEAGSAVSAASSEADGSSKSKGKKKDKSSSKGDTKGTGAAESDTASRSSASSKASSSKASSSSAKAGKSSSSSSSSKQPGGKKFKLSALPTLQLPSAERFQLQHLPHLLQRESEGGRDGCVDFTPDPWQVKLLNAVDAGSSVLVCAPTSSGKTFISSYVIEKVLREGQEGIVVIVLPTKALVNQVAAQVYKDFGDRDPTVYGIFTRDFRQNIQNSRVLVTVPACLEILLLTPSNRDWVGRIRYAVFDEVHCIAEHDGGDVWERLLLMMRCPLLALSATVGNPQEFCAWLQRGKQLQQQQDSANGLAGHPAAYRVELVLHSQRHNDLIHHTFLPDIAQASNCSSGSDSSSSVAGADGADNGAVSTNEDDGAGGDESSSLLRRVAAAAQLGPVWTVGKGGSSSAGGAQQGQLLRLHPAASVTFGQLAASGWPKELAVAPDEALQLFDAMQAVLQQAHGSEETSGKMGSPGMEWLQEAADALGQLAPEVYMQQQGPAAAPAATAPAAAAAAPPSPAKPVLVTRQAAIRWAEQLQQQLVSWAQADPDSPGPELAASTLQQLGAVASDAAAAHEAAWQGAEPLEPVHGVEYQVRHLMQLLQALSDKEMLPGIVFNFGRHLCELYAQQVCGALALAETRYRQQYAKDIEAKRRQQAAAAKAAELAKQMAEAARRDGQQAEGGSAPDGGASGSTANIDGIVFSIDEDESLPDPSFTFLKEDKARSEVLREAIDDLREQGTDEGLLEALARGIGVHHGGLDTKYRQAVEMLFRSKHLQLVIATGTLAYGIHMPCRTVVMAGDSVFLDALNFRQMSGRAGRRGLDPIGHVVSYALPQSKMHDLRVSALPRLRGQYLLTPTLVLRMLLLHQQLADKGMAPGAAAAAGGGSGRGKGSKQQGAAADLAKATASVMSIVQEPFLAATDAGMRQQLQLSFDFSLRYLQVGCLLDDAGHPSGLAGLATHLFWADPANLVLGRLLAAGVFHQLVEQYSGLELSKQLLMVVCHLFERLPMHPLAVLRWNMQLSKTSPSMGILPSLPPSAEELLQDHNSSTLQLLVQAVAAYIMQQPADTSQQLQEQTLPLSRLCLASPSPSNHNSGLQQQQQQQQQHEEGVVAAPGSRRSLVALLRRRATPFMLCSPFMALAGKGDSFASLAELLMCLQQRMQLHAAALPMLSTTDWRGTPMVLNAYVLDYFIHGQKRALARDNGILEGDVWQLLKSVTGILAAIANALRSCIDDDEGADGGGGGGASNEEVVAAFEALSSEFAERFRDINGPRAARR